MASRKSRNPTQRRADEIRALERDYMSIEQAMENADGEYSPYSHHDLVRIATRLEKLRGSQEHDAEDERGVDGEQGGMEGEGVEGVPPEDSENLLAILETERPPQQLIEVIGSISEELIELLKDHPEELDQIRPRQFEELVAEVLASFGWEVQLTPETRDGGYDIFAVSRDISGLRTSWIIECKKYRRDRKVGVEVARSLYGVKAKLGVGNAMLATTSYFYKGVHEFKRSSYDFELRDYEGVLEWINAYRPNPNGRLYIKDDRLVVPPHPEI